MRKINRNLIYVGAALALGLLASTLAIHYINRQVAAKAHKPVHMATTTVVVPVRNLANGAVLAADDLATRKVPKEYVSTDVLTPDNYESHLGEVLQTPLAQGAPIPITAVTRIANHFSGIIKPDRVAYTIQVNETNAISGLITPGDRIDLLLLRSRNKKKDIRLLLENVLVLATGKQAKDMKITDSNSNDSNYSNLTLELSAKDVQEVGIAQKIGQLMVMLQSSNGSPPPKLKLLTASDLLGDGHSTHQRDIQFIIGGEQ